MEAPSFGFTSDITVVEKLCSFLPEIRGVSSSKARAFDALDLTFEQSSHTLLRKVYPPKL